MTDDVLVLVDGDQRDAVVGRDVVAERVHELGDDLAVIAERLEMQAADRCLVPGVLRTEVHERTVEPLEARVPVAVPLRHSLCRSPVGYWDAA